MGPPYDGDQMTPAVSLTAIAAVRRALVIDDEGAIRAVLRRWLERNGWVVDEAEDGADALKYLGAHDVPRGREYDLIVADIRMPRMGGDELHHWLTAHRPELVDRLVISTGDQFEGGAAEFLASTGCRLLLKPFELSALSSLLHSTAPAKRHLV